MTNFPKLLSSSATKWAIGSWSLFIGENFILSENRTYLIETLGLGDDNYHYLYGTCSTAAIASIAYGYRYKVKDAGPMNKAWMTTGGIPAGAGPKVKAFMALSLGFTLVSQTFPKLQIPVHYDGNNESHMNIETAGPQILENKTSSSSGSNSSSKKWKVRCPFDFTDAKSQTNNNGNHSIELHGIDRVSRHPGLWSFGLIGLGCGFLTPSIPTQIWCSMPLMVALIGGSHTDSRHKRGMGGYLEKDVEVMTSNVPFLAMLTGRQGSSVTSPVDNVIESFTEFGKEVKPLNALLAMGMAGCIVASKGRGSNTQFARHSGIVR